MRVHADAGKRELAHAGLGDDYRAGRAQPPHHRRVGFRRRRIGQDLRARARRLAGNVEQVLDADDRTVEHAERDAGLRPRIGCIRGGARRFRIDRQAGARPLAFRIGNFRERLFGAVASANVITGRSIAS